MRLIDADALMTWFNDHYDHEEFSVGYISGIIREQPTVDAVPVKHGKWIRDEFGSRCSDCGLYAYRDKFGEPWESPYCPICGARMDLNNG